MPKQVRGALLALLATVEAPAGIAFGIVLTGFIPRLWDAAGGGSATNVETAAQSTQWWRLRFHLPKFTFVSSLLWSMRVCIFCTLANVMSGAVRHGNEQPGPGIT